MWNECWGTPNYVPPEIWLNNKYNRKVDIWSIGILTHLLLVGYLPFDE